MAIDTTTTVTTSLNPLFWFYRKLKSSLVKNISGFERKSFTRQNSPDSQVSEFKVPTLNSGFKISKDMTKPGSLYFGLVHLSVKGKTNPVLKRSRFVTNPEQFPLV